MSHGARLPLLALGLPIAFATFAAVATPGCSDDRHDGMMGSGGGQQACTAIGCDDGATITVAGVTKKGGAAPYALHVCVDAACADLTVTADACHETPQAKGNTGSIVTSCSLDTSGAAVLVLRLPALGSATSHVVAASVQDATGALVFSKSQQVTFDTSRPNGPMCEPVCQRAQIGF